MSAYHFITKWQVEATCQEVYTLLKEAKELPRWWRSVYLDIAILDKGDENGRGRVIELYTKGFLPYTLRWKSRVTAVNPDTFSGFSLEAFGDFMGRGTWIFTQNGKDCDIVYDWQIAAEKPLLKYLSFMMKPIFSANHHWAMNKGLESLKLELRRRAGEENVPPPPNATFPHNIWDTKVL